MAAFKTYQSLISSSHLLHSTVSGLQPPTLVPPGPCLAAETPALGHWTQVSPRLCHYDYDYQEAVIVFRQFWHRPRLPRLPQPQRQAVSKLSFQSGRELEFPLSSKKKSLLRIPDLLKGNGILMVTNQFNVKK